jgi:hypothetical protein
MVIFRVTENINIKTTDGTLVKYSKLKGPSNLFNETVYITTFEDFEDIKKVFLNVGVKYKARVIDETKIRYLSQFPRELGVTNLNEHFLTQKYDYSYKNLNKADINEAEIKSIYLNEDSVDLNKQLEGTLKKDISIMILGNVGLSMSEMICGCTSLRIFYEKLRKKFRSIKLDIYLNASENKFYSRDKMIFSNQNFINSVNPLSIDVKSFCAYDFFVDFSSVTNRSYFKHLSKIDAFLYKLGIDYRKIDENEKFNTINISSYKPKNGLKEKIDRLKLKGETLLFHPYSANLNKSIPKEIASRILRELIEKLPEYTIVSTIKIDSKTDDDRYVDLSSNSQNFLDFSYIVANMSKVVTVDTATYHIAEAFFIPTVVIFTTAKESANSNIYSNSKAVYVEDESKNFSKFIFDNDSLILHRFTGWNKLKSSKIIKLLETF